MIAPGRLALLATPPSLVVWGGTDWLGVDIFIWNGTQWTLPADVQRWDGTQWTSLSS